MIKADYDLLATDSREVGRDTKSDFTYILRMTLFRGSNEADRRYYLCDGEKAKEYRRVSYELGEMADNMDFYLDDNGRIKPLFFNMILEAVILSRRLILTDLLETRAQSDGLLRFLIDDFGCAGREKVAA